MGVCRKTERGTAYGYDTLRFLRSAQSKKAQLLHSLNEKFLFLRAKLAFFPHALMGSQRKTQKIPTFGTKRTDIVR